MTTLKAFPDKEKEKPAEKAPDPRILCIIPAIKSELNNDTLESIKQQTLPVAKNLILTQKITEKLPFPAKISKILNEGLAGVNLSEYDYILRVDTDVILPKNFLEVNLQANPDVMGIGYAQIIKVSTFQKVMQGKFHPEQDDHYHRLKMASEGYKNMEYIVAPKLKRKPGLHHGYRYFVDRGQMLYRLGFDPIHVSLVSILDKYYVFCTFGYLKAMMQGKKRFDIANYVQRGAMQKYRKPNELLLWLKTLIYRLGRSV